MPSPTQREMEENIMGARGQLGIMRIPAQSIPKMSQSETRTGDMKKNNDLIKKKMARVMKHVTMKGI